MKKAYNTTRVCAAFGVARSTFYDWQARQTAPPSPEQQRLMAEVRTIHRQTDASYGRRRMSTELRRRSFNIGPYRARTLMRQAGISAQVPKPPIYPKTKGTLDKVAPNYLDRQFDTVCPGVVFAGDITYIWTQTGWLYLAVVMDLCARRIVGWACSDTPDTDLVVRALRLALPQRHTSGYLLFHSDQGCQYTSTAFRQFLDDHDIVQSMSRRGNCWDNAPVERFFRSLKTERIRKTIYANHQEARREVNDYIANFYNTVRLHSAANGQPPAERHAELRKIA
jgi:putative transposase